MIGSSSRAVNRLNLADVSRAAGWVLTCVASGLEACAHMAEDTKTPSRTVPMAMFWSTTASYLMGWVVRSRSRSVSPVGADFFSSQSICVLVTVRLDAAQPSTTD